MHWPSLFVILVYLSGYIFLLFAAVCLACGLYYLIELAEEFTSTTRKLIRIATNSMLVLHPILLLYEKFPFVPCVTGFIAHLTYLNLLRYFPFMDASQPPFIAAVVMFLLDNFLWFRFFRGDHELFYRYRVEPLPATMAFFLLIIWLVPLALFCSLTVNESVLPGAPGMARVVPTGMNTMHPMESSDSKKRRRNIVVATLEPLINWVKNAVGTQRNTDPFR